jgi:cytochrome c-type biogenesis protein CcmH/NrfG
MNPETISNSAVSKSEAWSFRLLIAAVFLTPLAFIPTNYVALDLIKVCLIVLVAVIGVILQVHVAWKEKRINLLPKSVAWSAFAVVVSAILSSLFVQPIVKSFFGQGFELDTAGFIAVLFVMLCLSYKTVLRKPERAVGIYAAAIISFFILELLHALRFIFGTGFISLGILPSLISTVLGNWYALAAYALLALIITVAALLFLPLSRGVRIGYWIAAIAAFAGSFFVNDMRVWGTAAIVFLGLATYATLSRPRPEGRFIRAWSKRIAWLPLIVCVICAVFVWNGNALAGSAIGNIGAGYSEMRLPWQQTLDVGAGAIKDSPLLGAGPNRFTQAYIAHKPSGINATDAWSTEFTSGFGLIPTFFVTQGLLGIVAWIVFLVFIGIFGARALRRLPPDSRGRFIIVSSYAASVFLWLTLVVSVQPIAIVLLAFVMTGVFFGSAVSSGAMSGWTISFETRYVRIAPYILGLIVILAAFWGIVYVKNAVALSYFGAGVKALNVNGDPAVADADFSKALALDNSDTFWQARAEAGIAATQKVISSVTSSSPASTTQVAATQAAALINQSLGYAQKAVAYDPSNYYNYISEARVSTLAASINMTGAYDAAVAAYTQAIKLDPQNPALYLDLAQLQAQMNKLPDALQTLGSALQVKNNYLDAIYLLSQVEAAQGNLKDAITAAQVALQINPQSPLLYFQLGLLEYNNADYGAAASALEKAIAVQPDYSNARYFLGLSYARLGRTKDALTQFSRLSADNPDNQSVVSVITTLQSGKSLFTPASAPAAAAAKAPKLPLKQKGQ